MGVIALGAMAVGTVAIGRLAIGSLALKRGRARELHIGRLQIDELMIGQIVRYDDTGVDGAKSTTTSKPTIVGQHANAISFDPCSHLQHLQCSTDDDRSIGYVSTSADPTLQALGTQFARVG